jgi:uncharacterized membrane protein
MTGGAEAREGLLRRMRLRGTLRGLMFIIIMVFLALAFCLGNIRPGDAEYYISLFTLLLNTLLMASVLIADRVLVRGIKKCRQALAQSEGSGKADPWSV